MSESCVFCRDAAADFSWCRVCGRGTAPASKSVPHSSLPGAIRKARGHYTGDEVVSIIEAYNRGAASVDGPDVPLDLGPASPPHMKRLRGSAASGLCELRPRRGDSDWRAFLRERIYADAVCCERRATYLLHAIAAIDAT